jgi:hypothetical protein
MSGRPAGLVNRYSLSDASLGPLDAAEEVLLEETKAELLEWFGPFDTFSSPISGEIEAEVIARGLLLRLRSRGLKLRLC